MGYTVALRHPLKIGTFLIAVFPASFFHFFYNYLQFQENRYLNDYITFALLGLLILFNLVNFFRLDRKLARD